MSNQVLERRHSDSLARSNSSSFRPAWLGTSAAPFAARDARSVPRTDTSRAEAFRRLEDRQFLEMRCAFEGRGGWVSSDRMVRRMRHHWAQPISALAQRIVKRELVHVAWHAQILIPLFQFSTDDWVVRPVVRSALVELRGVFDDWEVASWFAQANTWLSEQRPVDLAVQDDGAVIGAARADRFIARG